MDNDLVEFANEVMDNEFFFDIDELPRLRGISTPVESSLHDNLVSLREPHIRWRDALLRYVNITNAAILAAAIVMGGFYLHYSRIATSHDRKIALINTVESRVFENAEQIYSVLDEIAHIDPDMEWYCARRAADAIRLFEPADPLSSKFVDRWGEAIQKHGNDLDRYRWFKGASEVLYQQGRTDEWLAASREAINRMYKIPKVHWNGRFCSTHCERLRKLRRFREIIEDTEQVADRPVYWMQRSFLNAFSSRATALSHFDRKDEAMQLALSLLNKPGQTNLTVDEIIITNSICANTAFANGDPELAERFRKTAERYAFEFVKDPKELSKHKISFMYQSVLPHLLRGSPNYNEIVNKTSDLSAIYEELPENTLILQTVGFNLLTIRFRALIETDNFAKAGQFRIWVRKTVEDSAILAWRELDLDSIDAVYFSQTGEFEKAVEFGQRAIGNIHDDGSTIVSNQLAGVHFFVGLSKANLGNFESAIQHFEIAATKTRNQSFKNECLFNEGICHLNIKENESQGNVLLDDVMAKLTRKTEFELLRANRQVWKSEQAIALALPTKAGQ